MTPSQLKYAHKLIHPDSHFFDRETMRFFGDSMRNYGVRAVVIDTLRGKAVPAWELYRKRPVKYHLQESAYFDQTTFEIVYPYVEQK